MPNVAINGFGRIGRTAFRVWWNHYHDLGDVVAINTSGSADIETWAHLLKYDSNYGVWWQDVAVERLRGCKEVTDEQPELGYLVINGKRIVVTAQRDPAKIPWKKYGVHTVIESTGAFLTPEKAGLHVQAGARRVVISAPAKEEVLTHVLGVSESSVPKTGILSNASCTTNCITPIAAVMDETFGVKKAMLTTIHAYTDDQNLQDNSHKDLRRSRSAAKNIVPTSTGAAKATNLVLPHYKGIFDGLAVRVPVATGSLSDLTFLVEKPTTVEAVNAAFVAAAAQPRWQGILAVTSDPIVSSDIIGRPESVIVDLGLTQVVDGDLVKVVGWYDNEWGYCNRLVQMALEDV